MARTKLTPAVRSVELPTFEGPSFIDRPAVDPPVPLSFHVYVRPRPPKQSVGLIALSKRSIKAQLAVCSIGQIVDAGSQAFQAGTPDLDPRKDAAAQAIKVGTWVHFRQHAGQKLKTGDNVFGTDESIEDFILVMADTDILGVFRDEGHAGQFYDWV